MLSLLLLQLRTRLENSDTEARELITWLVGAYSDDLRAWHLRAITKAVEGFDLALGHQAPLLGALPAEPPHKA